MLIVKVLIIISDPDCCPPSLEMFLTVTSPPCCARDAVVRVQVAEIWRGCKVQKVSGSGGFDLGVTREQGWPGSDASKANLRRGGRGGW